MSEEVATIPAPVAEVAEEPCIECEATKKDYEACILANGEGNCGDVLEAHKKCMQDLGITA